MEELLNPVEEVQEAPAVQDETAEVVDIQFRPGQKIYFFDPDGMQFQVGDHVVMDTARGAEFGICAGGNHIIPAKDVVAPLRKILRKATAQDEKINAENRAKEKRAFEICMQKIEAHGLDMQLVSAECAFDGSKILFYFTADERVDFRELVKDLASVFHTRIELRQIGVRDKAKMVGGLGICGRPFCCATFLDDFQPVSIKMAKTQSLSLNPTKISGTCGRLMCCLKYEQDTYEDLIRNSPKVDSFVDTPEGRGTVVESMLLHQKVKVQMEDNPDTVSIFSNEDIAILRSGKAKKTDPPIPADLAPISGSGKRANRPKEEAAPMLEPIRFRYSTEAIVEEKPEPEAAPETEERPRRERRRGNRPPRQEAPQEPEQAAEVPAEAAPKQEQRPRRDRRDRRNRDGENAQPVKQEAPEAAEAPAEKPVKSERQEQKPAEKPEEKSEQGEKQERGERHNRNRRGRRPDRPEKQEQPETAEAPKPEQSAEPAEHPEKNEGHRPRHNNNRRRQGQQNNPQNGQNNQPAQSQQERPAAPQGDNPQPDGQPKPHRRNNHYRHRKPKAPQGGAE